MTGKRRLRDLVARLPRTRAALDYAEQQHAGQQRSADGAPFVSHPIEVATLLYYAGAPDHVIAAGVLHDTVEKTSTEAADLEQRFGPRVTMLVLAVSEDPQIRGYHRRKDALRRQVAAAGDEALMVLAADKISKARELHLSPTQPDWPRKATAGSVARQRKLTHYQRCAELLEKLLPDSPLLAQLRTELEGLARTGGSHPALAGAS